MRDEEVIEHRLLDTHEWLLLDQTHATEPPWSDLPGVSIAPRKLTEYADDLPRLVSLKGLGPRQRNALLPNLLDSDGDTASAVAALFSSPASEERLLTHLGRHLVVSIPGEGEHLFRYYDPRVFRHLLWMGTPEQRATLFGPIERWTWRDARGQWRYDYPPTDALPSHSFHLAGLDLARIGILERCLRRLSHTLPDIEDDAGNALARQVSELLDEAVAWRLTDEPDLQLYVEQALAQPGIHQHPEVTRLLQAVCEDDSYVGLCSDVDTSTWNQYVAEIGHCRKESA